MAVLARIATSILFVAAALPAVLAHNGNGNASNCASHEFWCVRLYCGRPTVLISSLGSRARAAA